MRATHFLIGAAMLTSSPSIAVRKVNVMFTSAPADTSERIAARCLDSGGMVLEQDERHVICEHADTGRKAALFELFGRGDSTRRTVRARYTILHAGDGSRVQADQYYHYQTAAGQILEPEITDAEFIDDMRRAMIAIGAHDVDPAGPTTTVVPR